MKYPLLFCLLTSSIVYSQSFVPNYNEEKVSAYTLPELFVSETAHDREFWESHRRAEIKALFQTEMYGLPFHFEKVTAISHYDQQPVWATSHNRNASEPIKIGYSEVVTLDLDGQYVQLLLHLPDTEQPVPVFVGYNFCGNASVTHEPERYMPPLMSWSDQWANPQVCGHKIDPTRITTSENRFTQHAQGIRAYRWPFEEIIQAGYGVATLYYGQIVPDHPDLFNDYLQKRKKSHEQYSAIGVWAGGVSAVIDYLSSRKDIDPNKIIAIGHSRLGKVALWAAANDPRIRMVIANNSGEGGAALTRRQYGETLGSITQEFPHWFIRKYATYADRVDALPVDQHMLMALIAPRSIYVASAKEDQWADPKGEFLSLEGAKPIFRLYTDDIFKQTEQPEVGAPLFSRLNYHYRSGRHDLFYYDWQQFLSAAQRVFKQ